MQDDLRQISDEQLVQLCVDKGLVDGRPFRELFRRYHRLVASVCRRYFRDDAADDMVQDVFLKVHRGLHTFQGRSKLTTWLHTIATRTCSNEIRRRRRRPQDYEARAELSELDAEPESSGAEAETIDRKDRLSLLLAAMDGLKDRDREILDMIELQELSVSEVAERLNLGLSATKMRAHRARIALRLAYDQMSESASGGAR